MLKTLFAFLFATTYSNSAKVMYNVTTGEFLCDMTKSIPGVLMLGIPWSCPDTSQVNAKAWCSPWTGLLCSGGASSIVQIDLSSFGLSGSIPNSIGTMSTLKYLLLQTNNLVGTIPPSMGNLTSLLTLRLETNSLEGTVPNSLTKLGRLNVLNVNDNYLTGTLPSGFAAVTYNDDGASTTSSFNELTRLPSYLPTSEPSEFLVYSSDKTNFILY